MVRFENKNEEETITLFFTGRMDTINSTSLMETIPANLPKADMLAAWNIVFDLAEVDYISSSFIRICVNVAKMAAPGKFSIVNCQPFIKKTFKVSGLDEALKVS